MTITRAQVEDFFRARMDVDKYIKDTIEWIRGIVHGAGRERIVIGLSGGVDSAVSCALAALAVGPENVFAYSLPSGQSTGSSIRDAENLARKLGVHWEIASIREVVDKLVWATAGFYDKEVSALRRGNFAARARMCILMDKCEAVNGLLIGTENMTEHVIGYYTLYGDAGTIFEPICDLLKSEVRIVAEALGVTKEIIEKPPSAELWDGQTDEGEVGIPYHMMDLYIHATDSHNNNDAVRNTFPEWRHYNYQPLFDIMNKNAYKATIPICKERK